MPGNNPCLTAPAKTRVTVSCEILSHKQESLFPVCLQFVFFPLSYKFHFCLCSLKPSANVSLPHVRIKQQAAR